MRGPFLTWMVRAFPSALPSLKRSRTSAGWAVQRNSPLGLAIDEASDTFPARQLQGSLFDPVLDPERTARTVSAQEIEQRGGLPAAEVRAIIRAFGLPSPAVDEPWFTEAEAGVFVALAQLERIWPREAYLQVSRVYGDSLARMARTEVRVFQQRVEERLAAADDPSGLLRELRDGLQDLVPLADPILHGFHRRWIEHELAQAAVFEAERRDGENIPGLVRVALLFCDLKSFTAYADDHGDAAALAAIDSFDRVVWEERGAHGEVVKALGDGFMLAYPTSQEAVAAGHSIITRMRFENAPRVHASVHEGPAVFRAGDYFGRTVNLAARLLSLSLADELVATGPVVTATSESFHWEPRLLADIRGFSRPVELFSLTGPV